MPSIVLRIVRQLFKVIYVVPYSHLARFSSLVEVAVSSIHPGVRGRTVPSGRTVAAVQPRLCPAILQAYSLQIITFSSMPWCFADIHGCPRAAPAVLRYRDLEWYCVTGFEEVSGEEARMIAPDNGKPRLRSGDSTEGKSAERNWRVNDDFGGNVSKDIGKYGLQVEVLVILHCRPLST